MDEALIVNNSLRGNQIVGNGALGIDLGYDGIDVNDPLDGDDGGNGRQNYPTLASTSSTGQILGSLESQPNQTYEIDFYASTACDEAGYGQGEFFLGSTSVSTDGAGLAQINVNGFSLVTGQSITATATDANGSTSEFSACTFVDGVDPNAPLSYITDCDGTVAPPVDLTHDTYLPLVTSSSPTEAAQAGLQLPLGPALALSDGGVVTGVDGVSLGAIAGTLTTTLNISIDHTTAPTPTILTDPQVHGAYYHIAADENVIYCEQGKGFILGLPVPNGVPTDTLAIATISPQSDDWAILNGLYDVESELMLVSLSSLTEAGETAALIERTEIAFVALDINDASLSGIAYQPESPFLESCC